MQMDGDSTLWLQVRGGQSESVMNLSKAFEKEGRCGHLRDILPWILSLSVRNIMTVHAKLSSSTNVVIQCKYHDEYTIFTEATSAARQRVYRTPPSTGDY